MNYILPISSDTNKIVTSNQIAANDSIKKSIKSRQNLIETMDASSENKISNELRETINPQQIYTVDKAILSYKNSFHKMPIISNVLISSLEAQENIASRLEQLVVETKIAMIAPIENHNFDNLKIQISHNRDEFVSIISTKKDQKAVWGGLNNTDPIRKVNENFIILNQIFEDKNILNIGGEKIKVDCLSSFTKPIQELVSWFNEMNKNLDQTNLRREDLKDDVDILDKIIYDISLIKKELLTEKAKVEKIVIPEIQKSEINALNIINSQKEDFLFILSKIHNDENAVRLQFSLHQKFLQLVKEQIEKLF
ncbi:MAG: hypothetical protein ISN64_01725 [Rickettsia sp.]|nr:hypothetical protein [Rickettsia sp.]